MPSRSGMSLGRGIQGTNLPPTSYPPPPPRPLPNPQVTLPSTPPPPSVTLGDVLHPESKQQTTPASPRDALECVAALARTRECRQDCVRFAYRGPQVDRGGRAASRPCDGRALCSRCVAWRCEYEKKAFTASSAQSRSRPLAGRDFVTTGYLTPLTARPTRGPAPRTDGWLPSHGRLAALPPSTDSTCSSSSATWNDVRFELKHRARMGAT